MTIWRRKGEGWGWKVFCFSELEPENSVIRTLPGRLGKIKMIIYLFTYLFWNTQSPCVFQTGLKLMIFCLLQLLCAGIIDRYHLAWFSNIHRYPHHIDFFFFFSKYKFSPLNCLDFKLTYTSTLLNFKEKQLHNFLIQAHNFFVFLLSMLGFSVLGLLHDRLLNSEAAATLSLLLTLPLTLAWMAPSFRVYQYHYFPVLQISL